MIQRFFNIILTMLYMGYTPFAWNQTTTPYIVITHMTIVLAKLSMFVACCWILTAVVNLIIRITKNQK